MSSQTAVVPARVRRAAGWIVASREWLLAVRPLYVLAALVASVTGFEGHITWDTSKPNGQPRRSVDATRARELFGFDARTPLREGLERTVAWYREQALARA